MKRRTWPIFLFCLLLFATAFLWGEEVVRDYDRSFDFSQLKTYRWMDLDHRLIMRANPQSVAEVSDERVDQMIRSAVDELLKKKGFTPTTDPDADMLLSYFAVGELDLDKSFYDAAGSGNLPYNHWRPFYAPASDTRMNSRGTLTIDIVNPANNQLVWRGQATDTIKRVKDLEKAVKKVSKKVLSKFPPKK